MAITISGENNNDKILATDGVIDSLSGFNIVGVITATTFTGDLTGDVTGNLTGNVTGNINNSTLLLQTGGNERVRIDSNGKVGVGVNPSAYPGKFVVSGDALICDRDIHSRVASSVANSDRGFKQDTDGVEKLHLYADNSSNIILEGSGGSERLRITSDGNITFGIQNTVTAVTSSPIKYISGGRDYWNGTKGDYRALRLRVYDNGGNIDDQYGMGVSNGQLEIQSQGSIGFYASGAGSSTGRRVHAMTIDTGQKLLLGLTSARTNFFNAAATHVPRFQIESTNNDIGRAAIGLVYGKTNDSGPYITLAKHRSNTLGDNTVVQQNDETGIISFQGSDGSEFIESARIQAFIDGTPGSNDMPGRLVFRTTPSGAAATVERLRITSAGNVGIGSESPNAKFVVSNDGANGFEFNPNFNSNNSIIASYNRSGGGSYTQLTLSASQHIFSQGGTEYARIDSSGRLAFGGVSNNDDYDTNARNILLANESGNFGITIRSGGGDPYAMIHFADGTSSGDEYRAGRIFYQHSANTMIFATANVEKIRIDSSGQITNTGIATSFVTTNFAANFAKLDIRGTNIANSNHYILSYGAGHANNQEFHMVNTLGDLVFRTGSSSPNERLRITSGGNVNIGSNTSSNPFTYLRFGASLYGAADIRPTNEGSHKVGLAFYTDGTQDTTINPTERLRITSGGNVGIGTDNPSQKLNIYGTNLKPVIGDRTAHTPLYSSYNGQNNTSLEITSSGTGTNVAGLTINNPTTAANSSYKTISFSCSGTSSSEKRACIVSSNHDEDGSSSLKGNFYVSTNNGSGLQQNLQINHDGHVRKPNQPSFAASRTGGNVGNGNTIVFNSVKFNVGGHYNNTNGRFTAPTAGKYQFSVGCMAYGGSGDFQVRIQKNGSNYFNNNGSGRGHNTFEPYGFTVLMDMAVDDYAEITVYSSMSAVIYGTGSVWNIFSGHLVS